MPPVEEVHLNLNKIPVISVVMVKEPVKDPHVAMIRKSQMADSSRLALFHKEVEKAAIAFAERDLQPL